MKSVRIDDITYEKIVHHAKENSRTITATIGILVSQALKPAQQINSIDSLLEAVTPAKGTVFDETTGFATVDDAINFFATSNKPIHLEGSDHVLGLRDLIEYSDEMISLRREHDRIDSEIEKDGSDWQKLAMEQQEIKTKIRALVDKADNFIDNYQGLTGQGGPVVQ
jgi:hypothetical protein